MHRRRSPLSQSITRGTKAIKQKINEVHLLRWGACHNPVEENSLLRSLFVDKLQKELAVFHCYGVFLGQVSPDEAFFLGPQELTLVRNCISIIGHTRDPEVSNYHL